MKYRYLKGSAEDFDGAPEWARMKIKAYGITYFAEGYHEGAKFMSENGRIGQIKDGDSNFSAAMTIAHREPVADEDDLNGRISSSEYRVKAGELIMDGKWHEANLGGSKWTEALIAERGTRYGKFKDGAEIMQELKFVMREVDGWHQLSPSQKEALDMIQHKIGRILNGDPTYDDSWKDIAGYATLIVNELNGEVK